MVRRMDPRQSATSGLHPRASVHGVEHSYRPEPHCMDLRHGPWSRGDTGRHRHGDTPHATLIWSQFPDTNVPPAKHIPRPEGPGDVNRRRNALSANSHRRHLADKHTPTRSKQPVRVWARSLAVTRFPLNRKLRTRSSAPWPRAPRPAGPRASCGALAGAVRGRSWPARPIQA